MSTRVAVGTGKPMALVRLTRPTAVLGAAGTALVGAFIGGQLDRHAFLAVAATAFAVAAANTFNDVVDVRADSVNRPQRPLPAGVVTPKGARRLAAAAFIATLAFAVPLGLGHLLWAAAATTIGFAYSLALKRRLIIGHLVVAGLFANALLFGASASGAIDGLAVIGAVEVGVFILGREVLKGLPDIEGDQLDNVATVAIHWGWRAAVATYISSSVALLVTALAATVLFTAPPAHAAAMAVTTVAPSLLLAATLVRDRGDRSVELRVLDLSKLTWLTGLASVAALAG